MSSVWRLTWLAVVAKLRTVGVAPWFVMLAWGGIAALGEPTLFRSFDVWLRDQALFAVALGILAALLFAPPTPLPASARALGHAVLIGVTAAAVGTFAMALESFRAGAFVPTRGTAVAAHFALAAVPLGSVLAARAPSPRGAPQLYIEYTVMTLCGATTLALVAAPPQLVGAPRALAATALCVVASAVLMACSGAGAMMTEAHEDRNTR